MLSALNRHQNKFVVRLFNHQANTSRNLTSCLLSSSNKKLKKSLPQLAWSPSRTKAIVSSFTLNRNYDSIFRPRYYSSTPTPNQKETNNDVNTTSDATKVNANNSDATTSGAIQKKSWWFGTKERFKQKKAQFLLEYGSTFIFIHEILGITSYVVVFSLLSWGVIPVESILNFFGWTEADLLKYNINLHGTFTTGALTYVVVKGLDAMGLVPLRWFLTFTLTPRVAWFIGPKIDRAVAAVKRLFGRKPKPSN